MCENVASKILVSASTQDVACKTKILLQLCFWLLRWGKVLICPSVLASLLCHSKQLQYIGKMYCPLAVQCLCLGEQESCQTSYSNDTVLCCLAFSSTSPATPCWVKGELHTLPLSSSVVDVPSQFQIYQNYKQYCLYRHIPLPLLPSFWNILACHFPLLEGNLRVPAGTGTKREGLWKPILLQWLLGRTFVFLCCCPHLAANLSMQKDSYGLSYKNESFLKTFFSGFFSFFLSSTGKNRQKKTGHLKNKYKLVSCQRQVRYVHMYKPGVILINAVPLP